MSAPRTTNLSVIDLGVGMAAALVAQMLGRFGADLKRLEPPGGDPFADVYPADPFWRKDETAIRPVDLDAALATADVCILGGESWPGLDWRHDADDLARRFPALIVLEIDGYASADAAGRPAADLLVQARTGCVYEQYADRPSLFAAPLPTYGAAMLGVLGVQAALLARRREGVGQVVRTSYQEGAAVWMQGSWSKAERPDPAFLGGTPKGAHSPIYRCRDGKYVAMSLGGFVAVLMLKDADGNPVENLADIAGLSRHRKVLAACLAAVDVATRHDGYGHPATIAATTRAYAYIAAYT